MMIPCEISTFSKFICSAFQFQGHLAQNKSVNASKISNYARKGWKLTMWFWMVHNKHKKVRSCKKFRGLRQKLDALRVQNGQSLSKYQGFITKLVCYKGISFFWTYLNSLIFLCSKCIIKSHIINLQPFLTSFVIFHAFTDYFEL